MHGLFLPRVPGYSGTDIKLQGIWKQYQSSTMATGGRASAYWQTLADSPSCSCGDETHVRGLESREPQTVT